MSNFDYELTELVNEWLRRGDDPQSMRGALLVQVQRMQARIEVNEDEARS